MSKSGLCEKCGGSGFRWNKDRTKQRKCRDCKGMGMHATLPMSGEAHARRSDSDTSHEAAKSIRGRPASDLEMIVVETLIAHGPLTSRQVAEKTGVDHQSITPRFAPLRRQNRIRNTGKRDGGAYLHEAVV